MTKAGGRLAGRQTGGRSGRAGGLSAVIGAGEHPERQNIEKNVFFCFISW